MRFRMFTAPSALPDDPATLQLILRAALAEICPRWTGDRPFTADIERAAEWIAAGGVAAAGSVS